MKRLVSPTVLLLCINLACKSNTPPIKKLSPEDSLKSLLIGEWGVRNGNQPSFRIDNDSIHYYHRGVSFPYKITDNNIVIDTPIRWGYENVYLHKDTMFFYHPKAEGVLMVRRHESYKH